MNLYEPGGFCKFLVELSGRILLGQNPSDLADSLTSWFAAVAEGTAPRSGKIPWMTLDESAGEFIEALKSNIRR
jgi:hypothetical protein